MVVKIREIRPKGKKERKGRKEKKRRDGKVRPYRKIYKSEPVMNCYSFTSANLGSELSDYLWTGT